MFIVIVGCGEVGYNLARMLCYEHHDIVLIEEKNERLKKAQDHLDVKVIQGSGSDFSTLEKAGINQADMLVAVTDKDEVNILSCMIANQYGVEKKVARVKNKRFVQEDAPLNAKKLNIDLIIHPESVVAGAVVKLLNQTAATDILEFADGKIVLIGIQLDRSTELIDLSMADAATKYEELNFRTVAIMRRDRTIIPSGTTTFMKGDRIYITTQKENVDKIVQLSGKENAKIDDVMILGGGQAGAEIARLLETDSNVKIIESNADKSAILADSLNKSLVIRGDGRDINLLAIEGIIDMDAFISVTGDDETNIISCLIAKHLEVPRIISLINKTDYTPIIPTIGIDAYVSKQLITVDKILKFIRRGSIVSVASIPGMAAEVIEYIAGEGSKITRKEVKDLQLPKGSILGAVSRGSEVFIPIGNS
ncbi:MAG: Trk system potassium transporter TrkA, partial [Calditrichia bacterium]|nr:Trk system potassium transporter TrkA [Calditrichia bacterium]